MREVMILRTGVTTPTSWLAQSPAGSVRVAGLAAVREEPQLRGAPDRSHPVVHAELREDVAGVGAHGRQRDHQLGRDRGTGEIALEQAQHLELTLAEWLD